mmetsp:Transcript_9353/g.13997  ORF Transcript_9353/g.13997 Transcript_9353/m.13997 type:complete len:277 (-) Transcript_9353:315-1145(-)
MPPKRKILHDAFEELICSTCLQLVVDATQTPCCGSLFCRTCIATWTDKNSSCPCCRKVVHTTELIKDVRSERKSNSCLRSCKNHGTGCEFVGGRAEMIEHEAICEHLPPELLREKVLALTKELADARREISNLVSAHALEVARRKSEVTATAWQKGKDVLRKLNGLGAVDMFRRGPAGCSEIYYLWFNFDEIFYELEITVAHFNVSLKLICLDFPVKETHYHSIDVVLIHPEGPHLNKVTYIDATFTQGDERIGNWMTAAEFRRFFKDDMFAVGVL